MTLRQIGIECALVIGLAGTPWSLACGGDDDAQGEEQAGGGAGDPFGNADSDASTSGNGGSAGRRGTAGTAAGTGGRGTAGSAAGAAAGAPGESDGGTAGSADAGTQGAGGTAGGGTAGSSAGAGGGPSGTQPLGAVCANDGNCDQSMGAAVCCINECTIADQCPDAPGYLPCDMASDCAVFGGAKICCELGNERFCTKQSACGGRKLP